MGRLVLTRKVGQVVRVAGMAVKVERLKPGGVVLSFEGPRDVSVVREEAKKQEAA